MSKSIYIEIIGTMQNERVLNPVPNIIGFKLDHPLILIGSMRQASPSIVFKQAGVSRRQAKLFQLDQQWYVEDLGSDNGTWLISGEAFTLASIGKPLAIDGEINILFGTVVAKVIDKLVKSYQGNQVDRPYLIYAKLLAMA